MPKDDFEYISKIGKGSFSVVEKVKRIADGQFYAIKKVFFASLSDKEKEYSLNEIRMLASIKHPNIVSYHEAFFDSNILCIVMEYADGGDLSSFIDKYKKKKTYIPEQRIWQIFTQIVKGIQVIHQMNILHRDLKSANIFLTKSGHVKIGDFNVAKIAYKGLLATQTGTPYYMSPEIWKELPYNLKSDIWSLGVILYEMCALHMPFQASNVHALYLKITEGKAPNIPQCYSKELDLIAKNCLSSDAKKRPTASQLILMLPKTQEPCLARCSTQVLRKTIKLSADCSIIEKYLPKPNYLNCLKEVRSARKIRISAFRSNKSQQDMRELSHPLSCDRAFSRNESPFPLKPVKHIVKKIHKYSDMSDLSVNENVGNAPSIENVWSKKCESKRLKIYLNCIPSMKLKGCYSRGRKIENHSSTPSNRPLPPLNIGILSSRNNKYVEDFLTPLLKLKRNIKLIRGDCS